MTDIIRASVHYFRPKLAWMMLKVMTNLHKKLILRKIYQTSQNII